VIEPVGQGGMSVVYRGHDNHLRRDVAIKVLHPFLDAKAECRARLVREARAVARLEHPHILKIFDFSGEPPTLDEKPGGLRPDWERAFIVTELVRGVTLKRFAETHQLWKVPELGALALWQVLDALAHAHDNGVIHRDLKPENIMVREDGLLKLMDFGIAHVADQAGLTVTGTLLGSPAHMAPECIDGHHADHRSDVYSMATVLYWLLCGSLPFEAPTPHALLKQIVDGQSQPVQRRNPRVSDELGRLVARGMSVAPADRFASARAFADALHEVLQKAGVAPSAAVVQQALQHPSGDEVWPAIRAAHLERARQSLAGGLQARAASSLNRVLAVDAEDREARTVLEAMGAFQPEPAVVGTVDAADAPVLPVLVPPTTTRLPWRPIAGVAVVVAVMAGAVAVPMWVAEAGSPGQPGKPVEPVVVIEDGQSVVIDAPVTQQPPIADAPRSKPIPPIGEKSRSGVPPIAAATAAVEVTVLNSWADVYWQDRLLVGQTMKAELQLPPGRQSLLFKHPRAQTKAVTIDVVVGQANRVQVVLEPHPAQLTVFAVPKDAVVSVAGQGAMGAFQTTQRAMVIPLTSKQGFDRDVIISAAGYTPVRKMIRFVAGETTTLRDIVLQPLRNEPVPAP
jgi:eukaryotic-like serine/threonine-protein kinase